MRLLLGILLLSFEASGQTFAGSAALTETVEEAIREDSIPGAVLVVGHHGQILHRQAYGDRALVPQREAMTLDTIFDCASLTKVIATTSAVMKLFEQGKIRLNDRVTEYLPEFQDGKSGITVRNLLTHFSGLRPDLDLEPPWSGYHTGISRALQDKPVAEPGARFIYSDINFILLGEIVRRVSGVPLPEFVRREVFLPLGMTESMFQPPASLRARIAPTESVPKGSLPLRGTVHDETTRFMGGVAGHAGLFSTAGDLSKFAEMMLGKGVGNGVRVLSPLTVEKFSSPQSPPDQPILRGLGWDLDSPNSASRGELFPIGSYGHTGFTGTSLWIDPKTETYVILLTNSVHPHRRPPITDLRRRVSTIAAAGIGADSPGVSLTGYNETLISAGVRREVARNAPVMTGLDVLSAEKFTRFRGKRIGLITNHTGLDREGRRNIDLMVEAGVHVVALFSPEHGFAGTEDHENVGHTKDPATGVPVFSLYSGQQRRPTDAMLKGIDTLVFDIQDVGARFYTYLSTMAYAMEEAAKRGISFRVLDRPNPITGVKVEGPMLDPDKLSFIGYYPLPLRHGMTIGELARLFNTENHIGVNLEVVPIKNWNRGDWFDATTLIWINASPNMRSLNAATLYPGVAMLEGSANYSVGRGTDSPFEQVGADFIRGRELALYLNRRQIPGLRVYATKFRPDSSNFKGREIEGVRFVITNRELFHSSRAGIEIASALLKLYPGKISLAADQKLIGNGELIKSIEAGDDPRGIIERQQAHLQPFLEVRRKYLLY